MKLNLDNFWTRQQAADRAQVHTVTLDNWRRRGLLRTFWSEGTVCISRPELEKLLSRTALSWRKKPGRKTVVVNE